MQKFIVTIELTVNTVETVSPVELEAELKETLSEFNAGTIDDVQAIEV